MPLTRTIKVNVQSIEYPPRFELGTLRTIEFPLNDGNSIRMFCETVKGERPLLPNWGLPDFIHSSTSSTEETEAIILTNLRQFFSEGSYIINCKDDEELGSKTCTINYKFDDSSGVITVRL